MDARDFVEQVVVERLQQVISQLNLGHRDTQDSTRVKWPPRKMHLQGDGRQQ
jgi:hypothetical protein